MKHSKWTFGNISLDVGYIAPKTYQINNKREGSVYQASISSIALDNESYMGSQIIPWKYINSGHPAFGVWRDEVLNQVNTRPVILKKITFDPISGYYLCAFMGGTDTWGGSNLINIGLVFISNVNTISEDSVMHILTDLQPNTYKGYGVGCRERSQLGTLDATRFANTMYFFSNMRIALISNDQAGESNTTITVNNKQYIDKPICFYISPNYPFTDAPLYNQLYMGFRVPNRPYISFGINEDLGEIAPNYNPDIPFPLNPIDPYNPSNPSTDPGQDGGEGSRDDTSDPVTEPTLPPVDAVSTGFIKLYRPSLSNLNSLANFLWSSAFDLNTLKKLFSDPMDVIMGLAIFPVAPDILGSKHIILGNIDTEIACDYIGSQYKTIDCGSIDLKEFYGSYLDYDPYTSIKIYLPYIGYQYISPDYTMLKTISIKYKVDFLSGSCVAFVIVNGDVEYQFAGNMAAQIPITAANYSGFISSMIQSCITMGAAIAFPPSAGIAAASGAGLAASSVGNLIGQKIHYAHGGAVTGVTGHLSIRNPYLIIEFPDAIIPPEQNSFTGYPAYFNELLSSLKGFTIVDEIQLSCPGATQEEYDEIVRLLKEGVIL